MSFDRPRTPSAAKLVARRATSTVVLLLGVLLVGGAGGLWARSRFAPARTALTPADTVVVFGPREFSTPTGASAYHIERVTVSPGQGRRALLLVDNGAGDGSHRASGVTVKLKGQVVLTQSQLDASGRGREYLELSGETDIEVTVSGGAGAYVTARLLDVADPTFLVFDDTEFIREDGKPVIVTKTFTLGATPGAPFYLCVKNGNPDGTNRTSSARVWLNGVEVVFPSDLNQQVAGFVKKVTLEQSNVLEVRMESAPGSKLTICAKATDVTPPVLTVATPANRVVTRAAAVDVTGTVQDETPTSVTVNGQTATRSGTNNAGYASPVALGTEGDNTILVRAIDAAGLMTDSTRVVIRDTEAPVLALASPADGLITNQAAQAVAGTVQDRTKATVNVNGVSHTVGTDGSFGGQLTLAEGANFVTASATDEAGNATSVTNRVMLDTQAPVVTIVAPAEGTITKATSVEVRGTVADASATTVVVNGVNAPVAGDGSFVVSIPLGAEGGNTLTAVATDVATNQGSASTAVVRDTEAPQLVVTAPAAGLVTNAPSVTVTGTVADATAVTLTVDGVVTTVAAGGSFSANVTLTEEGTRAIAVVATDAAGNSSTQTPSLIHDTQPPVVVLTAPGAGLVTPVASVAVSGTVTDLSTVTVDVNGVPMVVAADAFQGQIVLPAEGPNVLVVAAVDAAGNRSAPSREVILDTKAPVITVSSPADGATVGEPSVVVTGTVADASPVTLTVNGAQTPVGSGGAFAATVALAGGANPISLSATDVAANTGTSALTVTRRTREPGVPPDPSEVAPPLDRTVTTTTGAATSFLYSGSTPIQTGVAPGTINDQRAAVIRGRVLDKLLAPLQNVTVAVRGRPELGETKTREDGWYDLVVNGGGNLTVTFAKVGYLPAERIADVPWQQFITIDDVVLLQPDAAATTLALSGTTTEAQVARATPQQDDDGLRRATMIVPAGTQATIAMPDGTTQPAPSLTVRLTEYTVGVGGPAAMPAPLPATSGYTYAVNVTADEAPAGATVTFTKPVALYVENFLGFPAGTPVPVGQFDAAVGAWVPAPNGRVIAVLSVEGGIAQVDANGDGAADTPEQLAAVGIDAQEQTRLAQTYQPGASLWRAPVTRALPSDLNWPRTLIGGESPTATVEPGCLAKRPDPIRCEVQVASQAVSVQGAPFALAYSSSRTPVASDRTLTMDLTGPTLPDNLRRIVVSVGVAGRRIFKEFSAAPNLRYTFEWDGRDAYGREVQGTQEAMVQVAFYYPMAYFLPPDFAASFGLTCTGTPTGGRAACEIPSTVRGSQRGEGARYQTIRTSLGGLDARALGMGGFTPTLQHVYDPIAKAIYTGDGRRRAAATILPTLTTVAGTGEAAFGTNRGDGLPAPQAKLSQNFGIAVGGDGSLYIGEDSHIRRVGPDGIMRNFAGTYEPKFGPAFDGRPYGDGGSALSALVYRPIAVVIAPDGSIVFTDEHTNRIRRIGTDGIIRNVAGSGVGPIWWAGGPQPLNDGAPAGQAGINSTEGVAVAPDGTVYFADRDNHRVRRVGRDGIVTTAAGIGFLWESGGYNGDNIPATQAKLWGPRGIALGPDGSLYIAEEVNHRVRRVGPDGIITTFAGTGTGGATAQGALANATPVQNPIAVTVGPDGAVYIGTDRQVHVVAPDGRISTLAGLSCCVTGGNNGQSIKVELRRPAGLAVGPDGSLYLADAWANKVLRIAPAMPGVGIGELAVASEDASEIWVFDKAGRHLRTLDARTKAILYALGYDAAGRLVTITDRDAQVTTIERDATGRATAVVAATGQRTALAHDGSGNLASVTGPSGRPVLFALAPSGLLSSTTDENGQSTTFAYDAAGRLISETAPDGGTTIFSVVPVPTGSQLDFTSAGGVTSRVTVEPLTTGGERAIAKLPDGRTAEITHNPDGSRTIRDPDGTQTTVTLRSHPLHGPQAPLVDQTIRLPSGLTASMREAVGVTYDELGDPLIQVDTAVVNGRPTLTSYSFGARTETRRTPAGRVRIRDFDELGRVVRDSTGGLAAVRYTYTPAGRIATSSQGGRTWTFEFDARARIASVTDPLTRVGRFGYDEADRMTARVSPAGDTTTFGYDATGAVTAVAIPGGVTHELKRTSTGLIERYVPPDVGDGAGPTIAVYDHGGRTTRVIRPAGDTIAYAYDSTGQPISIRTSEGTYRLAYDAATGSAREVTSPVGSTLGYQYDGGLLTRTTWSGIVAGSVGTSYTGEFLAATQTVNGANAVSFAYDADGLITTAGSLAVTRSPTTGLVAGTTLGSVQTTASYDEFGDPATFAATYAGATLYDVRLRRDLLGRIVERVETLEGTTTTFTFGYDSAGRVTSVIRNGVPEATYEYDRNGNRRRATDYSGTSVGDYDAQDRLRSYGSSTYAYDKAGQLALKAAGTETTRYRYSALGALLEVRLPNSQVIEYVVDGEGRRIGKKVNGALVRGWLYSGLAIVAELNASGAVVSRFVYADAANVPAYMVRAGQTYRLVADERGSVRLVVNTSTGAVAQRLDYDSQGRVTLNTNPGFQPFGFAGGLYDVETGFVRFGARDYDPETGRWTAKDPIGFSGGATNLYAYASGDAVNRIDPTGRVDLFLISVQRAQNERAKLGVMESGRMAVLRRAVRRAGCIVIETVIEAVAEEVLMDLADVIYVGPAGPGDPLGQAGKDYAGQTTQRIRARLRPHHRRLRELFQVVYRGSADITLNEVEGAVQDELARKHGYSDFDAARRDGAIANRRRSPHYNKGSKLCK